MKTATKTARKTATKTTTETIALATTIRAARANRDITSTPGGGTTIVGAGIPLFRFLALLTGLRFEVRCPGMRMTRGPKCSTIVKQTFGLKGNPVKLLAQLEALYWEALKDAESDRAVA